jgi:hypothetical protein
VQDDCRLNASIIPSSGAITTQASPWSALTQSQELGIKCLESRSADTAAIDPFTIAPTVARHACIRYASAALRAPLHGYRVNRRREAGSLSRRKKPVRRLDVGAAKLRKESTIDRYG